MLSTFGISDAILGTVAVIALVIVLILFHLGIYLRRHVSDKVLVNLFMRLEEHLKDKPLGWTYRIRGWRSRSGFYPSDNPCKHTGRLVLITTAYPSDRKSYRAFLYCPDCARLYAASHWTKPEISETLRIKEALGDSVGESDRVKVARLGTSLEDFSATVTSPVNDDGSIDSCTYLVNIREMKFYPEQRLRSFPEPKDASAAV